MMTVSSARWPAGSHSTGLLRRTQVVIRFWVCPVANTNWPCLIVAAAAYMLSRTADLLMLTTCILLRRVAPGARWSMM